MRLEMRKNLGNYCFLFGIYEVIFDMKVQLYYNCQTWMNVEFFAYQQEFCIMFMCPNKTSLWSGAK